MRMHTQTNTSIDQIHSNLCSHRSYFIVKVEGKKVCCVQLFFCEQSICFHSQPLCSYSLLISLEKVGRYFLLFCPQTNKHTLLNPCSHTHTFKFPSNYSCSFFHLSSPLAAANFSATITIIINVKQRQPTTTPGSRFIFSRTTIGLPLEINNLVMEIY